MPDDCGIINSPHFDCFVLVTLDPLYVFEVYQGAIIPDTF